MYLVQFIRGFCMALADSVPGVSGGTVAFLLGFYDQFIDSIDDLITGSREKKKAALFFLIKLGTGWVCGMILAILILASVFDAHIYAISSLFIGSGIKTIINISSLNTWFLFFYDYFSQPGFCPNRGFF